MSDNENNDCENCDCKGCDFLYSTKSIARKCGVNWVCEDCVKQIYGISFEDLKEGHL